MGIRIAVCGGNEETRLSLIRCLTPAGITYAVGCAAKADFESDMKRRTE